jgi:hypothetical protein
VEIAFPPNPRVEAEEKNELSVRSEHYRCSIPDRKPNSLCRDVQDCTAAVRDNAGERNGDHVRCG